VDAIYGKVTPFLKLAHRKGLETQDGREMLVYQGVLAMELFLDQFLPREEVAQLYREVLG
jgi:shikimate dehydrogenase